MKRQVAKGFLASMLGLRFQGKFEVASVYLEGPQCMNGLVRDVRERVRICGILTKSTM